jgi:Ca-activated chloride channel homolog
VNLSLPPLGLARPEVLLGLALVPALALLLGRTALARRRNLARFAGPGAGMTSADARRGALRGALVLVAVAAAIVALAGPQVGVREREVRYRGLDLVVALDVSQSMAVQDVAPDRLRAGRDLVESIGQGLAGSRVALVLFAGEATLRYPPTTEPKLLGEILDASGRGQRLAGGSSLQAGLVEAVRAFPEEVSEAARPKALLLVSDGEDPTGVVPDLTALRERGVRVYAVGIGTQRGGQIPIYAEDGRVVDQLRGADGQLIVSRIDEARLSAIAAQGGGQYWTYQGREATAAAVLHELEKIDTSEIAAEGGRVPEDRYQWPLAIALAALVAATAIGERRPMPTPPIAPRPGRAWAPRRVPAERPA